MKNIIYKAAIFSAITPVIKKQTGANKLNAFTLLLINNYQDTGKILQVLKVNFETKEGEIKDQRFSQYDDGMSADFFKKISGTISSDAEVISLKIEQNIFGQKSVFCDYKEKEEVKQLSI